eukprot:1157645-Pelagomonas_calceolata.AAC.6
MDGKFGNLGRSHQETGRKLWLPHISSAPCHTTNSFQHQQTVSHPTVAWQPSAKFGLPCQDTRQSKAYVSSTLQDRYRQDKRDKRKNVFEALKSTSPPWARTSLRTCSRGSLAWGPLAMAAISRYVSGWA